MYKMNYKYYFESFYISFYELLNLLLLLILIFVKLYLIITIIVYIICYKVQKRKTKIYNLAVNKANKTNKLLMVIGDPNNGSFFHRYFTHIIFGIPYGYGDLCIDLNINNKYKGNTINAKLEDVINTFHTNSYVIYISQTLEYIDSNKLNYVLKELIRVSNNDLYIVNMIFDNDSYYDYHDKFIRKTYFTKTPPEYNVIEYYNLDNKNKRYIIYLDNNNSKLN